MLKQSLADSLILIVGMNVQVIDEIIPYSHEGNQARLNLSYPNMVFLQDMIAKVILIFIKEMAFGALKLWQGFFAGNSPQDGQRVEILRMIFANKNFIRHGLGKN